MSDGRGRSSNAFLALPFLKVFSGILFVRNFQGRIHKFDKFNGAAEWNFFLPLHPFYCTLPGMVLAVFYIDYKSIAFGCTFSLRHIPPLLSPCTQILYSYLVTRRSYRRPINSRSLSKFPSNLPSASFMTPCQELLSLETNNTSLVKRRPSFSLISSEL